MNSRGGAVRAGQQHDPALVVLRALADPARIKILDATRRRASCVTALVGLLGLTQPTVSHHVRILAAAGLITRYPAGAEIRLLAAPHARTVIDAARKAGLLLPPGPVGAQQ